ncbi:MAG: hypothetical protein L6Q71_02250 [Planctomycetes bacterium]|nr:hypothetical protein [Planctomycetota bacterium]
MTITEKKAKFAADLVKKDKSITKSAVAKAIVKKFKTAMDPVKLREVFIAAGGKVQERGRTKGQKAEKVASQVSTRSPGRRGEDSRRDRLMTNMTAMANHLVVVMHDGIPAVHSFTSQRDAEKFVEGMLAKGHTPAQIAFYGREALKVTMEV